jgi:hypothetical protein
MNSGDKLGLRLPRLSVGMIAGVLLLAPLPIGLRTAGLTALAFLGIGILLLSGQLGTSRLRIPAILLGVVVVGTLVAHQRGDEVSAFQFARTTVFPCLLLWLLYERISPWFLENLERLLPFLVLGSSISLALYFGLQTSFYNSTLDIPYEDAVYKRLYVYPTYLFLVLLFDAVRCNRSSQFIYAILLSVAGSKTLMACIVAIYIYFGLRKASTGRLVLLIAGAVVLLIIAQAGGLFGRFADLMSNGDPWRYLEPLAAGERLADPLRFLIGNGGGVPYWQGHDALAITQGSDSRVVINSMYDVHNGFMTLALRFGVPGAIAYTLAFVRSVPSVDGRALLVTLLLGNILLSHGPVELVEAVGLALGIRLLSHRTMFVEATRVDGS